MLRQRLDESGSPLYWAADVVPSGTQAPFSGTFTFPSPLLGLVHVYYWTVLVGFHQCVYSLLNIIFECVGDFSSGTDILPEIPPAINLEKYQPAQTRMLVANICRSLDFSLQTTAQPNLLAAPLWVVAEFYHGIGQFGDGDLERQWCAVFQGMLQAKIGEMSSCLQEKKWIEVKQHG